MSHSYFKIWIHALWSTKDRHPIIPLHIEDDVHQYLTKQFRDMDCPVSIINGMPDHVHCLFLMNPKIALADIIKQVKGSTSHFINHNDLITDKFSWQTGYAAYSVSGSDVERVFQYIKDQKIHHKKKSFKQEYDEFIENFDLPDD